ncbi:hypothetical protein OEZ85_010577 [Tetradesmus obliquus]|uniref:Protein kinase domain-containing protein n=1 Tax=Tetradesmus obliquus TaxID=3088 RepID=A0ABY8TN41_TETOB|nr:hypothetical protein OEZ85_010577 [Tetradesmus obliquus]
MAHVDSATGHQAEAPSTPSGVPAGLKSTFSKIFGSTWGSDNSGNADSGGGLIAAFRAMMPKSGSLSGSDASGVSSRSGCDSPLSPAQSYQAPPPPSPGRKSTLLAMCPQLPPSMHRKEWCLDDYIITDKLYKGYASMVYKAICKRSRETVVLKCYLMSSICELYQHQIYREVRLHSSCQHENIIKLFAAFQEGDRVVMVQEYADGGDLFNLLQKYGGCLSERIAVQMVLDPFLRVLQYLHTRAIIHRDIKPENILFADKGSCLKLADFGLAIDLREERAVTRAGTLDYMAPEVLKCPYKSKPEENKEKVHLHYSNTVDSWAVGVLVYELLVGCPPFYDKSKSTTEARIVSGVPHFPPTMSEAAKNFICAALRKNPEERPSVLEMVHHPWVELYRARRSMRQLNIMAGVPTSANSSFTTSQVAAAAAAAGAATAGISTAAPASSSAAPAGALSARDHAHHGAVGAAAAVLNAAKKNLKHTVTSKVLAAPPMLIKGGSVKVDEQTMSFLFGGGRAAGMNLAGQVSAKHASHATAAAAQAATTVQTAAEKTNESDMLIHACY